MIWKECTEFKFLGFGLFLIGERVFIFHWVIGLDADERGWDSHVSHIITTVICGADLLESHAEESPLSILSVLRGITRYERGRGLGCVTDGEDWGWSVAGARIEGFWSFRDGGSPGCPSGGIFWDDLSSGWRMNFGRIWRSESWWTGWNDVEVSKGVLGCLDMCHHLDES